MCAFGTAGGRVHHRDFRVMQYNESIPFIVQKLVLSVTRQPVKSWILLSSNGERGPRGNRKHTGLVENPIHQLGPKLNSLHDSLGYLCCNVCQRQPLTLFSSRGRVWLAMPACLWLDYCVLRMRDGFNFNFCRFHLAPQPTRPLWNDHSCAPGHSTRFPQRCSFGG